MLFMTLNQQCQSTEGTVVAMMIITITIISMFLFYNKFVTLEAVLSMLAFVMELLGNGFYQLVIMTYIIESFCCCSVNAFYHSVLWLFVDRNYC